MTWIRSQWQWHIIDPDGGSDDGWPVTLCLDFEPPEDGVHLMSDTDPLEDRCIECVREREWLRTEAER